MRLDAGAESDGHWSLGGLIRPLRLLSWNGFATILPDPYLG